LYTGERVLFESEQAIHRITELEMAPWDPTPIEDPGEDGPRFRGGINIMSAETLPDFDAREVDILRTVEDEQPDASWPREVWRGELVIPDVPLTWTGGGTP
jgi:hypothetical protein